MSSLRQTGDVSNIAIIIITALAPFGECCNEDACVIGTAVGTGACTVGAGVSGALAGSSICAATGVFTFGLSCLAGAAIWAGIGAGCTTLGSTVTSYCSECAQDEEVDNFNDILDKLDGIELTQADNQVQRERWFQQLARNDKNIVLGQAKMISRQQLMLEQLDKLVLSTDLLANEVERSQIISLYGDDLIRVINVQNKFERLTKGKFDIIIDDNRAEFFRDAALDSVHGLESSMDNIFLMMIGGHLLKGESIYAALNGEYCKPEIHKYLLDLQVEAMILFSVALAMESHTVSPLVSQSFSENMVKATSTFVQHCGCPIGFEKSNRGSVSTLLSKLPESSESLLSNTRSIFMLDSEVMQAKFLLLLEVKNIEPTRSVQNVLNGHTVEDIELVVEKLKSQRVADLKLHDFADICINKERNSDLGAGFCCFNSCYGECGTEFYKSEDICKLLPNSCNPRQCAPWCGSVGNYHKCTGKAAPECT